MIKLEHIYRESNQAADYLAGFRHSLSLVVDDVSISDPTLSLHLLYDLFGIFQSRLIFNEKWGLICMA
ncbi:hypothetical protein LINGRAHAP2_LOCUS16657 [Linum grandiflorum]